MNQRAQQQLNAAMQQANLLLQQGRATEAKHLFEQIAQAAPDFADAHFRLAFIELNAGNFEAAIDKLKRVLVLRPNNPAVLTNLGHAYTKSNQRKQAIKTYEKLLKLKVSDQEVYFYLASAYADEQEAHKALKLLQQAIQTFPDHEPLYSLMARINYDLKDYEQAKKTYEKAYEKGFRSENLLTNLAKCYDILGLTELAFKTYQEGSERYPENLSFFYQLNRHDKNSVNQALGERLHEGLKQGSISKDNIFYAKFLLATQAKKQAKYEEEFQLLEEAHAGFKENAVFGTSTEFVVEKLPAFALDRNYPFKQVVEDKFLSSLKPIFLMGVPRSGSTFSEAILASGDNPMARLEESTVLYRAFKSETFQDKQAYWRKLNKHIKHSMNQLGVTKPGTVLTDKSLENFFFVDLILTVFPKAKIIWNRRHPIASIMSILNNNMFYLPWAHDIESILRYFEVCNQMMEHWIARYPENIYTLSYEELVTNPTEQSQRLFKYCELEWSEECLEFYKQNHQSRTASNIQIRRAVNTDSVSYAQYDQCFEPYVNAYPWLKP